MAPPPRRPAAAARSKSIPGAAGAESKTRRDAADTRWLQTLSEPELDLLMGLKELAVTRASNAGHPDLADKVFHLRALRALAFVLLQESKERLRQTSSVNNKTSMLERLALLNDPDPDDDDDDDDEVLRPSQDEDVIPMPNDIHKKRKQILQDGRDGDSATCAKRRRATRED